MTQHIIANISTKIYWREKFSPSKSGGNYWREADYILAMNQIVTIWDLLMKTKIVVTNMWLK